MKAPHSPWTWEGRDGIFTKHTHTEVTWRLSSVCVWVCVCVCICDVCACGNVKVGKTPPVWSAPLKLSFSCLLHLSYTLRYRVPVYAQWMNEWMTIFIQPFKSDVTTYIEIRFYIIETDLMVHPWRYVFPSWLCCPFLVLLATFRLFYLLLSVPLHFGIHLSSVLTFPLTSSVLSYLSTLPFLLCLFLFWLLLPTCSVFLLAKGNSTTSTFEGSYFPGKIQFVLAMYLHINHSEGFIYKM